MLATRTHTRPGGGRGGWWACSICSLSWRVVVWLRATRSARLLTGSSPHRTGPRGRPAGQHRAHRPRRDPTHRFKRLPDGLPGRSAAWLSQFTPDECRGLVDYLDGEAFIASHLPVGQIPVERDHRWVDRRPWRRGRSYPGDVVSSPTGRLGNDSRRTPSMVHRG